MLNEGVGVGDEHALTLVRSMLPPLDNWDS